ncbi:hypothetical protein KBTX_02309 [wastewater metagenome]|uniref:Uncharacterized protein n=2 Tax=unclassified sequences TaxID=12908 RepID=A0A5B8RB17_9ZZZZ|nr:MULTISPECIES: BREX-2 system phosphatase PglZ [Arhodomonas]QEA05980.1 hypothetical protein KBTEX_02309 [uncultured organism]
MATRASPSTAPSRQLTPDLIRARAEQVIARHGVETVGISATGEWAGEDVIQLQGQRWPVRRCDSVLELGLALNELNAHGQHGVVLSRLHEADLPEDMRARLCGGRLYGLDPWDSVLALFAADRLDPRIPRAPRLAELLISNVPPEGYPSCRARFLDADTVWRSLFRRYLGFDQDLLDAKAVMRWLLSEGAADAWRRMDDEVRQLFRGRIEQRAGRLGLHLLDVAESEYAEYVLAIGLVCELIFDESGSITADRQLAAGRLERYLAGQALAGAAGRRWFALARDLLGDLDEASRQTHRARAQAILDELQISDAGGESLVLQRGYEHRLQRYADALTNALDGRAECSDVGAALQAVRSHELSPGDEGRLERLDVALRLLRYLNVGGTRGANRSLEQLAVSHRDDASFVDWGRRLLLGGDAHAGVSAALERLLTQLRQHRETLNKRFAEALANWDRTSFANGRFVGLEAVLDELVAPLARQSPVLFLVMDGMDYGAYRELEADLSADGWISYGPAGSGRTVSALSTLPSVTRVARASLFSGRLCQGQSDFERNSFANHQGLLHAIGSGKSKPTVYHKAALSEGGGELASDVREAIANPKKRLLGVVVNAIDDHLDKSDQLRLRWSRDQFRQLDALLESARVSGRTVVLTSDHGHVMDWHSHQPVQALAGRWRDSGTEPVEGEIRVANPAVREALGVDSVIVPWSERIRYVRRSNGYHGGATPQEIVVPVGVFRFMGSENAVELSGWDALPAQEPAWWAQAAEPVQRANAAEPAATLKSAKLRGGGETTRQASLFEQLDTTYGPEQDQGERLVEQLLASPTYHRQRKAAGRIAPKESVLRQFLHALLQADGRLSRKRLAAAMDIPELRVRSQFAAMQKLLNVDGYAVVGEDASGAEIVLDTALLRKQFEISEG